MCSGERVRHRARIARDAAWALKGLSPQGIGPQPFVAKHFSYLNSQMTGFVPLAVQAAAASLQARIADGVQAAYAVPITPPRAVASRQIIVTDGFLEKYRFIVSFLEDGNPEIVIRWPPSGATISARNTLVSVGIAAYPECDERIGCCHRKVFW